MEVRKGYKQTEVGLIPQDWIVSDFENVCLKIQDGTHFSPKIGGTEFLYVTSKNVKYGFLDLANADTIDAKQHNEIYKRCDVKFGDLLLTKDGANTGNAAINNFHDEFSLLSSVAFLRFNPDKYNANFFLQQILSSQGQQRIKNEMSGNAITRLTLEKIDKLKIIVAPFPEQTAIATALSDADALIISLEKLIAKKRNIKQGAMQELLKPKEGWVAKTIQSIADVGRGRVISHKEIATSVQGKYPVYSSQTSNNGIMGYIDTFDFEGEYVTWTTDGVNAGTVFYRNGRFNCTNVCGTIKLKRDCPQFVALLLNSITPKYVSRNLANPKLMNDPVKRIEIPLPDVDEQKAIAAILYKMEDEIDALDTKLAKYKMIKQGMMQTLLTGQIRLI